MIDGNRISTYAYNGNGDRLQQTVNGVTTNYTLDLNTGLIQVLDDNANTYLYGRGRIAQTEHVSGIPQYFLGDARRLHAVAGSVRQLADATGEITLARSYTPYGEVLSSAGWGETSYSFTGEMADSYSGLLYLRARYYAPGMGRFLSRDTWRGDEMQPDSYNAWLYVYANPVNLVDPTGMMACVNSNDSDCIQKISQLLTKAQEIKNSVKIGNLLPVEGFAQFTDKADDLFDHDIRGMMWGMTRILIDVDMNDEVPVWFWGGLKGYMPETFVEPGQYYIGQNFLPYKHDPAKGHGHSERGDWHIDFWDETPNQAYHF
ncbi:MAG: RHS repeat-associated core domain-containing protein [Chloroflexota bacterium]